MKYLIFVLLLFISCTETVILPEPPVADCTEQNVREMDWSEWKIARYCIGGEVYQFDGDTLFVVYTVYQEKLTCDWSGTN